jgi:putative oxidoreductase
MILGRFSETLYALFRIVAGLLFACHGAQKVLGAIGGQKMELVSKMGLAGVIELVGGVLILIGLFASWAAFLASGEMAVAYFTVHAPQGFWPIENGGELAALYAFAFLFVAAKGAGKLSVAAMLKKPKLG